MDTQDKNPQSYQAILEQLEKLSRGTAQQRTLAWSVYNQLRKIGALKDFWSMPQLKARRTGHHDKGL